LKRLHCIELHLVVEQSCGQATALSWIPARELGYNQRSSQQILEFSLSFLYLLFRYSRLLILNSKTRVKHSYLKKHKIQNDNSIMFIGAQSL